MLLISLLAVGSGTEASAAVLESGTRRLALGNCPDGPFGERHLCGTLEVPEDRSREGGRRIPIFVAVMPAGSRNASGAPIFLLSGGPSLSATAQMPLLEKMFASLNEQHDFVAVDLRGTGHSNPLRCSPPGPVERLQSYAVDLWPEIHGSVCREELEAMADLRQYTIPLAMRDLDEVRAALGYETISLLAISYGTRMAQEYIRRYPDHVERAVLFGALPPSVHTPQGFARRAQEALTWLFDECESSATCAGAYPDLAASLETLLARLERAPVSVQLPNPATGKAESVEVRRGLFGSALRAMLYETDTRRLVPRMIHEAAAGDFTLAAMVTTFWQRSFYRMFHHGTYYSITCSEDVPYVDVESELEDAATTFVGDYRIRQQLGVCRDWPRGVVPEDFHQPVKSDVPVLLVSGAIDPVTPPSVADKVARHLTRSWHLVLANRPHDPSAGWEECAGPLIRSFLSKDPSEKYDVSCGLELETVPFTGPHEPLPFP